MGCDYIMRKSICFLLIFCILSSLSLVGCNSDPVDENTPPSSESTPSSTESTPPGNEEVLISEEDAYNKYYDLIERFVPELMKAPQECDVDITIRDEVTFLTEHFERNTNVKIKSQVVDGKLQYYLVNQFPAASKMNFYCINDDKFYGVSCGLNEKGKLVEYPFSYIGSFLLTYLNTPVFEQAAIKSLTAEKEDSDVVITFVVSGPDMEYGFPQRVMREINPSPDDELDDVTIVLTIDSNGIPKAMSTKLSMSILNDDGTLHAQKSLDMDFVFNKFDNVDFDLQNVISEYASDASAFE